MTTQELRMMMLDIDGVLSRHGATAVDLLAAAQQMAVSAVGDLVNKGSDPGALHKAADAIADQIRAALHKRIDEGKLPEW